MKSPYFILSLLAVLVCFASSAFALPLTNQNGSLEINVTKDVPKNVHISVHNPNPYTLFNVHAEGEYVTSSSITIPGGQNATLSLTVQVPLPGTHEKTVSLLGFTRINCSDLSVSTRDVNITPGGANPKNLEVCKNTNIRFLNNYGSSIWVVIESMGVNQPISANGSHVQNFPTLGLHAFKVEPLIDLGYATVVETAQDVFNAGDQGSFNIKFNSIAEPTNISAEFSKTTFNVTYNELASGIVTVTNTGTRKAENIRIQGEWLTFDKNNFNLNPGEVRAVNFVVSPMIQKTSDTGKNYTKVITMLADNVIPVTYNLTIIIPFAEVASGNLSSPEWWIKRKEFCDAFPTAPDCITEPVVVYRNVPEFGCPDILANMSPMDVKAYMDEVFGLREDFASFANNQKLETDVIKQTLVQEHKTNNQSLQEGIESSEAIVSLRDTVYLLIGLAFLGTIGGIAGYIFYRKYQRDKMLNAFNTQF